MPTIPPIPPKPGGIPPIPKPGGIPPNPGGNPYEPVPELSPDPGKDDYSVGAVEVVVAPVLAPLPLTR